MTGTSRLPSSGTPRCLESAALRIRRTTGRGTVIDACLSDRRQGLQLPESIWRDGKVGETAVEHWGALTSAVQRCLTAMLSNRSHRKHQFLSSDVSSVCYM